MLLLILLLNSTVFIDSKLYSDEYYNIIEFFFMCLPFLTSSIKKKLDIQRKLLKIQARRTAMDRSNIGNL